MFRFKSIYLPVAYSENTICAINPQDFQDNSRNGTFSRASRATRINEFGQIEEVNTDIPRLDYQNGDCPELLLEDASTNHYEKTDISNNVAGDEMTATPATLLGYPAARLEMDAGVVGRASGARRFALTDIGFEVNSADNIVYSVLMSPDTADKINIWLFAPNLRFQLDLDINGNINNLINTANATEINSGSKEIQSGVYRVWFSFKTPVDATFSRADLAPTTAGGICTVGFPQVEIGSEPTSFIPTDESVETRESEFASLPVPNQVVQIKRNNIVDNNFSSNYIIPKGRTKLITMQ